MWGYLQTIRHKTKKELVRIIPTPDGWEWKRDKISVVDKFGNKKQVNVDDYIHIEDETGRPYSKEPEKGKFVDETAEKYLVSRRTLLKMRKIKFLSWEKEVLHRMTSDPPKSYKDGLWTVYPRNSYDVKNKYVSWPFSDGSYCHLFAIFFLKRRNAKPLYRKYNSIEKRFINGPMVFEYNGQTWIYEHVFSHLVVIKK